MLVQEYLGSKRIREQKAAIFSLNGVTAHMEIGRICLIYLLEPGLSVTELDENPLARYPLAHFAPDYWYHHYTSAENQDEKLDNLILKLFRGHQNLSLTL